MKLVDTNVLVYAVVSDAPHHARSKEWLERAFGGVDTVLLPWVSLIGFIRIVSNPRIHESPVAVDEALRVVDEWLERAVSVAPVPDARHPHRMRELLTPIAASGGNIVNDAHLAALAVQYGATVVTFDSDFGRFPGVKWEQPGPG
ncbi:TA system VapC family ribonuclease toxin [Microbacterium elymi]|uniref:Ribonuclease VapC n=1 Tax=Microbacterium elymi TaxID=2909587 RepID=A0ABY5NH07_9MICO|nr:MULTISPECIES: TA system VapC family ribonuclease toxin [Microbacterium]UUT34452.1 PIN domain-containing protein [Microbacterium elymi]